MTKTRVTIDVSADGYGSYELELTAEELAGIRLLAVACERLRHESDNVYLPSVEITGRGAAEPGARHMTADERAAMERAAAQSVTDVGEIPFMPRLRPGDRVTVTGLRVIPDGDYILEDDGTTLRRVQNRSEKP